MSEEGEVSYAPGQFTVDFVHNTRKERGQRYFLVRWKGYNWEGDTWEPEGNVPTVHAKRGDLGPAGLSGPLPALRSPASTSALGLGPVVRCLAREAL